MQVPTFDHNILGMILSFLVLGTVTLGNFPEVPRSWWSNLKSFLNTNFGSIISQVNSNESDISDQSTAIGPRTYTEDNYVTDEESVTASVDALDMGLKDEVDRAGTAEGLLIPKTQRAAANGVATLDENSKIPEAQIPPLAIIDIIVSAEATLADYIANEWTDGSVQKGDVVSITLADETIELWQLFQNNGSVTGDYKKIDASKVDWSNVLNKPTLPEAASLPLTASRILESNADGKVIASSSNVTGADIITNRGYIENLLAYNNLPNNRILYDQYGIPGVYVFIPKFNWDPINGFASTVVHPAFIWNGVEHAGFWYSKFKNVAIDKTTGQIITAHTTGWNKSNAVGASLPFEDPAVFLNFNEAIDICEAKNSAQMRTDKNLFHAVTNAEAAAIAIWTRQMIVGTILAHFPRGNNNYGQDIDAKGITGAVLNELLTIGSGAGDYGAPYYGRWRTGSGGPLTAHNLDISGIFDMNGLIWEWIIGLQSPDAGTGKQAWIIPNNEAAIATPAQLKNIATAPGAPWVQIGEWGSLTDEVFRNENATAFTPAGAYSDADAEKLALIAADGAGAGDYGNDYFYKPDVGENNVPLRAGGWSSGLNAGLFALDLTSVVTHSVYAIGFRSAFVGNLSSVT